MKGKAMKPVGWVAGAAVAWIVVPTVFWFTVYRAARWWLTGGRP